MQVAALVLVPTLFAGRRLATARRPRRSVDATAEEISRIHRVAAASAPDVVRVAEAELTHLLHLRACRFEAPPFARAYPRIERSGALPSPDRHYRFRGGGFELPAEGAEVLVVCAGKVLGRFVFDPRSGRGASREERSVAVAIADQVGVALAAPGQPDPELRADST